MSRTVDYKAFLSDQDVRWCPGCDDYIILRAFARALAALGLPPERHVVVSGIGCASRLPYYVNTYGLHGIHGRAPAIATGVKMVNPDLYVWVITGDGDALAIGTNHFLHAIRRNIDINILLFNNEIYGLTKGQFSPTSRLDLKTRSSPQGNIQPPFHIGSLVLGADVSFYARVPGNDLNAMTQVFVEAARHKGTSVVEILQNCPVFNDGVFHPVTDKNTAVEHALWIEHGRPLIYGKDRKQGIVRDGCGLRPIHWESEQPPSEVVVHDEKVDNPAYAFALTQLSDPTVFGIIRRIRRPTYEERSRALKQKVAQSAVVHDFIRKTILQENL